MLGKAGRAQDMSLEDYQLCVRVSGWSGCIQGHMVSKVN
jgi:hypothetical protein